jgi:17beta-estradiol 17-dehydrogenase / very-long-chain 3-oxoacyl-CoA reductase
MVISLQINYVKKYGEWAVITGATDGLGLEFAREYARRKFKIFLISRNEDKLRTVAEKIRADFRVEVTYMPVDFTDLTDEKLHKIDCAFQGLDLGVLVNNVGVCPGK